MQQQNPGTQITAQELTLTPTYSSCQAFGLAATFRMNGCKYTITGKSKHFTNQNVGQPTHDVHADITISGITYELHGAFCPGGGATGLRHNATLHGKATFKAFKDPNAAVLTTEHGHQFLKSNHTNAQVGLQAT